MEFGARRAQGIDASVYGAKASYIAGVDGTSNVLTGKLFNIPVLWHYGSFLGTNV